MSIDWGDINWGDFPTWFSAVTTFGALVAAGWVVRIEMKRENRTEELLAEQRDDRARSEQADRVAAWPDWHRQSPAILVRNGSHLPIYEVRIQLTSGARSPREVQPQRMLPPGDHWAVYPADIVDDDGLGNITDTSHLWNVRLYFEDTANRRWVRMEDGRLLPDAEGDLTKHETAKHRRRARARTAPIRTTDTAG